jgi:hypothetical protein
LTLIWAVTSSALRAPPLSLVGKHAARPAQPVLVALSLLGLGVANAMSPYLGLTLRGVDPRIPFLLSSVALALVTLGWWRSSASWCVIVPPVVRQGPRRRRR